MTARVAAWTLAGGSLLALVGLALVWGPLWWHFRVAPPAVGLAIVQHHRQEPADRVLDDVAAASMMTDHPLQGEAAVAVADGLLRGELVLPALPALRIEPDFAPSQLERGVPVQQVFIASLIVPDLLLRAHEHRPDPRYVAAAEHYLLGFADYEAGALFPTGLLFNPHAVANRAAVLARAWRHLRGQTGDAAAATLHRLAVRTAALLAQPSMFVAATNHGVMQNVALLQLAAAFPALPGIASGRDLALQRLARQLPVYVGDDGGVLEHSAGYHFHGVVLTGYVVRMLQLAGQPVPPAWQAAHDRARQVLATLQRPDGSLPSIGNTYRYRWQLPRLIEPDPDRWARALQGRESFDAVFPVTGWAVWWDAGPGTQTVVPWGYFGGHGHARAQEMSLLIWSAGTDWNGNTGYWPNSDEVGFELAAGWSGGNAPHLLGEGGGERRTTLLRQVDDAGLRLLDLERLGPAGTRVRRQVLQWQGRHWLALDSAQDPQRRALRVLWTGAPETSRAGAGDRAFALTRAGTDLRFTIAIDGSEGVSATPLSGSRDPFGGWVAFDRRAAPAPAIDARLPGGDGWMLTSMHLGPRGASAPARPRMQRYAGPEDWTLSWPVEGAILTLTRQGAQILLAREGRITALALAEPPPAATALDRIARDDMALRHDFPRWRTAEAERRQRSWGIVLLWAVGCVALLATRLWRRQRAVRVRA